MVYVAFVTLVGYHVLDHKMNISAISWQSFGASLFCGCSKLFYLCCILFICQKQWEKETFGHDSIIVVGV